MATNNEPSGAYLDTTETGSEDPVTLLTLQQNIASMATVMRQFIQNFSQQGQSNIEPHDSQQGLCKGPHAEDAVSSVSPQNYSDFEQESSSDEEDKPQKRRRLITPCNEGGTSDVDALLSSTVATRPQDTPGDILKELNEEISREECVAAAVSSQLADIINKRWQTKMPSEKLKSLLTKYNRPENCENLTVPRVNSQIWNNIEKHHKMSDVRMSHVQEHMVKACTAIARSLDHLINTQNDPSKIEHRLLIEQLVEATALLGNAHHDMSLIRRAKLKPAIRKEYADLCSSSAPVTSLLFGDDLNKQLEDLKKGASLTTVSRRPGVSTYHSGYRPGYRSGYGQPYDNRNVKKPFLGRGQKFNTFRKKQQMFNAGHSKK